jgi:hypothetical protein
MQHEIGLSRAIRLDPVKFRVALPAADPPDNANDQTVRPADARAVATVYCGYPIP